MATPIPLQTYFIPSHPVDMRFDQRTVNSSENSRPGLRITSPPLTQRSSWFLWMTGWDFCSGRCLSLISPLLSLLPVWEAGMCHCVTRGRTVRCPDVVASHAHTALQKYTCGCAYAHSFTSLNISPVKHRSELPSLRLRMFYGEFGLVSFPHSSACSDQMMKVTGRDQELTGTGLWSWYFWRNWDVERNKKKQQFCENQGRLK